MKVHKIIFEEVQKIVNEYDPVGLVRGGAPPDEYHTEVGKIVAFLRSESDRDSLANKVEGLFRESFGNVEANRDQYLLLSQKLLDLKKRLRW